MAKVGRLFGISIIANGGTTSTPFNVPENACEMTIYTPALTGTLSLQSKRPIEQENETEVWATINVFDLNAGGANIAIDAIPASAVTTLPTSATGKGALRFLSSGAEAAERDIRVEFGE